jgi:hypothetical protein
MAQQRGMHEPTDVCFPTIQEEPCRGIVSLSGHILRTG